MEFSDRDGMSELQTSAVQLHELYTSFMEAGFDKVEALRLVIAVIQTPDNDGGSE